MQTILRIATAIGLTLAVIGPAVTLLAAADSTQIPPPPPPGSIRDARVGFACEISGGPLQEDKNDFTNGFFHQKGVLTFRALRSLRGVNLRIKGPYGCTCVNCPSGSWYSTGLKPGSTFDQNESRQYAVDCSVGMTAFLGGSVFGAAEIDHFVQTQSSGAGVFKTEKCKGKFTIAKLSGG